VTELRLVFFGSSEFAVPPLQALAAGPDPVALVIAPPPAPAGRGRELRPAPAAAAAGALGQDLFLSRSARSPEALAAIRAARPDLLVVAAFGGFLPPELLALTPWPPLNVHPSLLPRHRGPAPVSWSLIHGDAEVGVSIIFLEEAMDAGPILRQRAFPVAGGPAGAGAWENILARAGAEELLAAIADLKAGRASPRPQDQARATVNPLLTKADGRVDFRRPAPALAGLINGVDPWPGATTTFNGRSLKIFGASAEPTALGARPGQVLKLDARGRLVAAAGSGTLALSELQPEGKKRLKAADFWHGYHPEILGDLN
jgi:methionyl-tRNA formyltransferase